MVVRNNAMGSESVPDRGLRLSWLMLMALFELKSYCVFWLPNPVIGACFGRPR